MEKVVLEYTFQDGLKVSGSLEQILSIGQLKKEVVNLQQIAGVDGVSISGYYNSKTKGLIKISDMNNVHLMNSFCYSARTLYEKLSKKTKELSCSDFVKEIQTLSSDSLLTDLANEINKRASAETTTAHGLPPVSSVV